MKKIYFIGNFSENKNNINGQVLRSRNIKEYIEKIEGIQTNYLDVSQKKINLIDLKNYFKADKVILMLGENGLKYLLPLLNLINKFLKKDVYMVTIGGWLPEFLLKRKKYIEYLKKFKKIYVQTKEMKKKLEILKLNSIEQLLNFKNQESLLQEDDIQFNENLLKFVFISRVRKDKGIEDAIDAIQFLLKEKEISLEFHIYGPIDFEYEVRFQEVMKENNRSEIKYKGVINPLDINEVLKNYDVMLFPTRYEGEGFPGVIVDANNNGLIVIASDWKYNKEFVEDEKDGFVYSLNRKNGLYESLEKLLNNKKDIVTMKKNSKLKAKKYAPDVVMESFRKEIKK